MILDVEKLILKNTMKNIKKKNLSPGMTRKERRQWYHENRKKYNLPRWGELHTLNNKKTKS